MESFEIANAKSLSPGESLYSATLLYLLLLILLTSICAITFSVIVPFTICVVDCAIAQVMINKLVRPVIIFLLDSIILIVQCFFNQFFKFRVGRSRCINSNDPSFLIKNHETGNAFDLVVFTNRFIVVGNEFNVFPAFLGYKVFPYCFPANAVV